MEIEASSRELVSKGDLKKNRSNGFVPGIVYLKNKKNLIFSLDKRVLDKMIADPSCFTRVFCVSIDGEIHNCMLKEVQFHQVKDVPTHFDLMEVSDKEVVKVSVPVRILNKAVCPGVKTGGDVFVLAYNVDLKCKVGSVPEAVDIDVAESKIGGKFFISDVLPKGCEFYNNIILAKVSGKKVQEETTQETAEADSTPAAEAAKG